MGKKTWMQYQTWKMVDGDKQQAKCDGTESCEIYAMTNADCVELRWAGTSSRTRAKMYLVIEVLQTVEDQYLGDVIIGESKTICCCRLRLKKCKHGYDPGRFDDMEKPLLLCLPLVDMQIFHANEEKSHGDESLGGEYLAQLP